MNHLEQLGSREPSQDLEVLPVRTRLDLLGLPRPAVG
jgi:hypothetical protein